MAATTKGSGGFGRSRARAAAGVVVIAALAAACSEGGATQRATGPTTSGTAPGRPAPTATVAVPSGPAYAWSKDASPAVSALAAGTYTTIAAVVSPAQSGAAWTAAGTKSADGVSSTATVWSSPDAVNWTATALTGALVDSRALAATRWKSSTVVVGSVGSGAEQRAAVWVSPAAGAPFGAEPVVDYPPGGTPVAAAGPSEMTSVTIGNLGYFATGVLSGQPAVWYSTNGLQWAISASATRFFDGLADPLIHTTLATANVVYAAGSVRNGTATDAALWSTADGLSWRAIQPSQGAFSGAGNHVITGLASLGSGFGGNAGLLAVGGLEAGGLWSPVSWISPDGVSWSQPSAAFPRAVVAPGGTGAEVRSVTGIATLAGTSEFVAVGGSDAQQRVWRSGDGVRWTEVPLPTAAADSGGWRATLVASNGPTTLVADGDDGQAHLLVGGPQGWSEPTTNPGQFGPVGALQRPVGLQNVNGTLLLVVRTESPGQAIGPPGYTTSTLTSSDGINWTPSTAPATTPAGPPGATAVGRIATTWVAVGNPVAAPSGAAVGWGSPDGSGWASTGALDAQPGIGAENAAALCSNSAGTTVVAVGRAAQPSTGGTAVAWYSTDGRHWRQSVVGPAPAAGASERMTGCLATPAGFEGYGVTALPSGAPAPALWSSTDGSQWTLEDTAMFSRGSPAPISGLAASGSRWVAVGGGPQNRWPLQPSVPAISPTDDQSSSGTGVWVSSDGGSAWQREDTSDPVWQAAAGSSLDQVAFAGATVVVAGETGGRLAVWTGTPRV